MNSVHIALKAQEACQDKAADTVVRVTAGELNALAQAVLNTEKFAATLRGEYARLKEQGQSAYYVAAFAEEIEGCLGVKPE